MNDEAIQTSADPTQCEKILAYLQQRAGTWVPMPDLAAAASCYAVHSRIADLREAGHEIRVKLEGVRPRRSWYQLVLPQPSTPQTPQ